MVTFEVASLTAVLTVSVTIAALLLRWRGAGYNELFRTCEVLQQQITALNDRMSRANAAVLIAEARVTSAESKATNIEAERLEYKRRTLQTIEVLRRDNAALRQQLRDNNIAVKYSARTQDGEYLGD